MGGNQETSLEILSQASAMLAKADTIQKVKEFKSLALTAVDWAKRKGMGEEAVRYARSYALRAEIKLGSMLAASERATGAKGIGTSAVTTGNHTPPTLAQLGITKRESAQAQRLAALPVGTQERIIAGGETKKAHVVHNSGENEWYTPSEYLEAARVVMGDIDCDPASCEIANHRVGATVFYTAEDDGLSKPWGERVWLNPPYSQPLVSQFAEVVVSRFEAGEIKQAVILVNNATETAWFQRILLEASAVCFVTGRIKFFNVAGRPEGAPLQGQAVLYLGENWREFIKEFSVFGIVMVQLNESL